MFRLVALLQHLYQCDQTSWHFRRKLDLNYDFNCIQMILTTFLTWSQTNLEQDNNELNNELYLYSLFRQVDGQWVEEYKDEAYNDWVTEVARVPNIGIPVSSIATCSQVVGVTVQQLLEWHWTMLCPRGIFPHRRNTSLQVWVGRARSHKPRRIQRKYLEVDNFICSQNFCQ